MQTTVRDRLELKQSPEQRLHGPMNHSPTHLALLVHSRNVLGVRRMSQRSVLGGLLSQKTVRNCCPVPHSDEHCSLLQMRVIQFSFQFKMLNNRIKVSLALIKSRPLYHSESSHDPLFLFFGGLVRCLLAVFWSLWVLLWMIDGCRLGLCDSIFVGLVGFTHSH